MRAAKGGGATPVWAGGRMPLSTTLADAMVEAFARAANGIFDSPELEAARPMLEVQAKWSALPTPESLLVETLKSREGLAPLRLSVRRTRYPSGTVEPSGVARRARANPAPSR